MTKNPKEDFCKIVFIKFFQELKGHSRQFFYSKNEFFPSNLKITEFLLKIEAIEENSHSPFILTKKGELIFEKLKFEENAINIDFSQIFDNKLDYEGYLELSSSELRKSDFKVKEKLSQLSQR